MSNVSSIESRSARRLHDRHAGVDGRSAWAIRFRKMFDAVAEAQGLDPKGLTPFQRSLVRAATSLTIEADDLSARVARGERIEAAVIVGLSDSVERLLARLGRRAA